MNTSQTKGYLFALGAVLIWSGFILISKMGGNSALLSYDIIAIRYLTCAFLVFPFWLLKSRFNLFRPKFIISSLIGGFGYAILTFNGFEKIPTSHAAVLLPGLLPISTTVLSIYLNGEKH